jgi:transposase
MKGFELSEAEIFALRLEHKKRKNVKEAYRINAVILLGSGWTLEMTSLALLLDEETLRNYVRKYLEGGIEKLLTCHYVANNHCKLSEHQVAELKEHITNKLYRRTIDIINHVKVSYNVDYSRSGMTKLLHSLGFTYKKPKLIPSKINLEQQEEFKEYFLDFIDNKSDDEAVLFLDATHPQYCTIADYGWIAKGQDFGVASQPDRGRVNIVGAINIESMHVTSLVVDHVGAQEIVGCIKAIEDENQGYSKLHIILDNAGYHKAKILEEYVKSNDKINLVFLPPYSPNLNLIERLWGLLRRNELANKFYESYDGFKKAIIKFLQKLNSKSGAKLLEELMSFEFQELTDIG